MALRFSIISLFNSNPYDCNNLLYISAALRKHGYPHSLVFHLRLDRDSYCHTPHAPLTEKEIDLLVDTLRRAGTDIAGITVYYHFAHAAAQLTARIKEQLKIPVIWGGTHPTAVPLECLQHADMVCRGDGEEAVTALVQRLSDKEDARDIPGLWLKRAGGGVIQNSVRFPLADLNDLAFPFLDEKSAYYVCEARPGWRPEPPYSCRVSASRGCYFACSYCGEHILKREYPGRYAYRVRRPENVIQELKEAVSRYSPRYFTFDEPMFPYESSWIHQFCALYKEQVHLPFYIRTHPRFVTREHIDLLVDAGLYHLNTAIESGSERVRREVFRRPESNAMYLAMRAHELTHKKLRSSYNLIMDNPFEDAGDRRQALDFILSIPGRFSLVLFQLNFFPKTDLTERALAEKRIDGYHLDYSSRFDGVLIRPDYRRTKEQQLWSAVLCLAAVRSLSGFPPRRFIAGAYANKFLNRHPGLFFQLSWFFYAVIMKINKTIARLKR